MTEDITSDPNNSDNDAGGQTGRQHDLVVVASFIAHMRNVRFFLAIDPRISRPRVHPLEKLTDSQRQFLKENREAVAEVLRLEALGEWSVLTPWDVRWKVG